MKKLLTLGFLLLSTTNSFALTPSQAAKLAEQINNQEDVDNYSYVSTKVARPFSGPEDEINGQLWENEDEVVIVLNTKKEQGSLDFAAFVKKFHTLEETIEFTRSQGRVYNALVKEQGHIYLSGGLAQKTVAAFADYAVWGVASLVRGAASAVTYTAAKGAEAYTNWQNPNSNDSQLALPAPAQVLKLEYTDEFKAEEAKRNILNRQKLHEKVTAALTEIYDDLAADVKGKKIYVVGHCLAGYYAQYLAFDHDLSGYSFGAMGFNLSAEDSAKADDFRNYVRKGDLAWQLNQKHYGPLYHLADLRVEDVVGDLAGKKNKLEAYTATEKHKEIADRYAIMSDYLTHNHAIEGYAEQLAGIKVKAVRLDDDNDADEDLDDDVHDDNDVVVARVVAAPAAPQPPAAPAVPAQPIKINKAQPVSAARGNLLAAIQAGKQLKKVADEDRGDSDERRANQKPTNQTMFQIAANMDARRKALNLLQKDDNDDNDGDEW